MNKTNTPKKRVAANVEKPAAATKKAKHVAAPEGAEKIAAAKKVGKPTEKAPRPATKSDMILGLLRRPSGASAAELTEATGWQAHSVRGFLSAVIGRKMGLTLASEKNEQEERRYSLTA